MGDDVTKSRSRMVVIRFYVFVEFKVKLPKTIMLDFEVSEWIQEI